MTEHAVVVAGGGPTGLMLAAELALAGTEVVIVEPRATQALDGPRAGGLHARTLEVLDQRGVADRFLTAGNPIAEVGYAYIGLDLGDAPTRHPYLLALRQPEFERIMAGWVLVDLGVPILRNRSVVDVGQGDGAVDVELSDGSRLRAAYVVGCDGGRSVVRRRAGVDFPGLAPATSWLIAEVALRDQPPVGVRPEGGGIGPVDPTDPSGPYRIVLREPATEHPDDPAKADLVDALVATYGTDFGAHEPRWISRFTDGSRQAVVYRHGRVLLAGDAAHVHPPHGGQGLNLGVQDAVNLGWKLALVAQGSAPDTLLDSYHAERHPVGARVLHDTNAQVALTTPDDRHRALHATMVELLGMDEPRRRVAARIAGLDIRYDLGDAHPVVGRRLPDLDLETDDGPARAFTLLHDGKGVLLELGDDLAGDIAPWADRVRVVQARTGDTWELPVIGDVPAPPAVLVRPDGHVAWTGDPAEPRLVAALRTWFGPPRGADAV